MCMGMPAGGGGAFLHSDCKSAPLACRGILRGAPPAFAAVRAPAPRTETGVLLPSGPASPAASGSVAGDEAPFFGLPYLRMGGVPAFRYLGN